VRTHAAALAAFSWSSCARRCMHGTAAAAGTPTGACLGGVSASTAASQLPPKHTSHATRPAACSMATRQQGCRCFGKPWHTLSATWRAGGRNGMHAAPRLAGAPAHHPCPHIRQPCHAMHALSTRPWAAHLTCTRPQEVPHVAPALAAAACPTAAPLPAGAAPTSVWHPASHGLLPCLDPCCWCWRHAEAGLAPPLPASAQSGAHTQRHTLTVLQRRPTADNPTCLFCLTFSRHRASTPACSAATPPVGRDLHAWRQCT
jgi:hypothetical protein